MKKLMYGFICVFILAGTVAAEDVTIPWDMQALSTAPKVYDAPHYSAEGVQALFYEGLPWQGKPTRVFAYYALPEVQGDEKAPAMVLVHGGGGSAFIPWVQLWVSRGYAAIAMDTCGCISSGGYKDHPRHEHGGPPGWGGFDQDNQPVEDQWTYHAVADVILAHSLIRSFPQVDKEKIGLTGISWGGYLACIVAGVDHRFKFAAPVYGCGFLGDNSVWRLGIFQKIGPERSRTWLSLWDPSVYLPQARMPMLWVDGTNDFAFPMDSLQRSYRLPDAPRTLCTRVRMPHGHGGPGENPEEIHVMAESIFRNGVPLAWIIESGRSGRDAWAVFESRSPLSRVELNFTTDSGVWKERNWQTIPATLDAQAGRVSATLPKDVTVYYFTIIDERELLVSTEHEELLPNDENTGDSE